MQKTIIGLSLLLTTIIGCGQQKQKLMEQKMLDIYKTVKTYDGKRPFYEVYFANSACTFEILVNDMQIYNHSGTDYFGGTRIDCMAVLLQSGKQTITVRMYPPLNKDTYKSNPFLVDKSELEVKVLFSDYNDPVEKHDTLLYFKTPTKLDKDGKNICAATGLPYYEHTDTFQATVPYKLEGWRNGKDLRKEDPAQLEKEVVSAYKEYIDIMERHDVNAYGEMMYQKTAEMAQSVFQSEPSDSKSDWEDNKSTVLMHQTFDPLEHYKMAFYGDGKMVALIRTDNDNRGESAIIGEYKEDGRDKIQYYNLFLQKKAGSDKLTPIR